MENTVKVLIAEDEPHALMGLAELISGWGYTTETARDGQEAWEKALAWDPAIVVTDLKMPRLDGIGLLNKLAKEGSGLSTRVAVVVLTAMGSVQQAVDAMKLGAYDFLQKPVDATRLRTILGNATRQRETAIELEVARRRLRESGVLGSMVGSSQKMREAFALIEQIAPSNVPVLITGESGTGKELVARTLHALSPRKTRPFVAVNCAAIPETLIESEIFGHEKGAFTGAAERRAGCFELASGGTLLLDEVGEMPIGTQAKLLRVLEESNFLRLGGTKPIQVDVRIIAATNKVLKEAVTQGEFREDLYYRLNVVPLFIPPLRERREDILPLALDIMQFFNKELKKSFVGFGPAAAELLQRYPWPGNIRELRNVIERTMILSNESEITAEDLPEEVRDYGEPPPDEEKLSSFEVSPTGDQFVSLRELEDRYIHDVLNATGQNKTHAARILGIHPTSLLRRLKKTHELV